MVVNKKCNPVLIIEQDGKSHDSEKLAQKDKNRNKHYGTAGIPFIIMKTSVIKSLGVTPAKYLDGEIERLKWRFYP